MKRSYILIVALAGMLVLSYCKRGGQPAEEAAPETTDTTATIESPRDYIAEGSTIVDTTFKTLSGALQGAVKEGGIEHAIQFCNLNAYPLVAELSEAYDANISRKAVRYRNPDNAADERDARVFAEYEKLQAQGLEFMPVVLKTESGPVYYKPIVMMEFCTVCHGSKEQIGPAYEAIAALYPEDKAIDFKAGDLRGLWKVEF